MFFNKNFNSAKFKSMLGHFSTIGMKGLNMMKANLNQKRNSQKPLKNFCRFGITH